MAYYNVCPDCGSNLDPGERCDCQNIRAKEQEKNRLFFSQMLRCRLHLSIREEVR